MKIGTIYRHKKRGTLYRIIGEGRLQLEGPNDMMPVVVYEDIESGDTWTRLYSEFHDGRFEKLEFSEAAQFYAKFVQSELDDVRAFHQKFNQLAPESIRHLTLRKMMERVEFIREEGVTELTAGASAQDMEKMVDALIDAAYVVKGTAVMLGISGALWDELWADVQRANMAKVLGTTHRGNAMDVTKPPGWEGPKTAEILARHGYNIDDHFVYQNGELRIDATKLLDDQVHLDAQAEAMKQAVDALERPHWSEVKGDGNI